MTDTDSPAPRCPRCGSSDKQTSPSAESGCSTVRWDSWHDAPPAESPAPRLDTPCECSGTGWIKTRCLHHVPPVESPAAGEGLIERVHDKNCLCHEACYVNDYKDAPGHEHWSGKTGPYVDPRCLSLRAAVREAMDEATTIPHCAGCECD